MGPVLTYSNICSIIWFATVKSAEHRDSAIEQCKCGPRELRIADDHLTLIPSRIRAGFQRDDARTGLARDEAGRGDVPGPKELMCEEIEATVGDVADTQRS